MLHLEDIIEKMSEVYIVITYIGNCNIQNFLPHPNGLINSTVILFTSLVWWSFKWNTELNFEKWDSAPLTPRLWKFNMARPLKRYGKSWTCETEWILFLSLCGLINNTNLAFVIDKKKGQVPFIPHFQFHLLYRA